MGEQWATYVECILRWTWYESVPLDISREFVYHDLVQAIHCRHQAVGKSPRREGSVFVWDHSFPGVLTTLHGSSERDNNQSDREKEGENEDPVVLCREQRCCLTLNPRLKSPPSHPWTQFCVRVLDLDPSLYITNFSICFRFAHDAVTSLVTRKCST